MTKDRIIDVLVMFLVSIGTFALVERFIVQPQDTGLILGKLTETLALPVGLLIRLIKWANDEKLELIKQIEGIRMIAGSNREGFQGLSERLVVSREEIGDLSNQIRDLSNTSDRRLVYLESTTGLVRKLDALELRLNDLDSKVNGIVFKEIGND